MGLPPEPMHMTKAKPVGASHPGDELLYLFAFYGTFWLHLNICLMNRRPVDQDLDGAELLTQTQNMVARMPEVVERSIEHCGQHARKSRSHQIPSRSTTSRLRETLF